MNRVNRNSCEIRKFAVENSGKTIKLEDEKRIIKCAAEFQRKKSKIYGFLAEKVGFKSKANEKNKKMNEKGIPAE